MIKFDFIFLILLIISLYFLNFVRIIQVKEYDKKIEEYKIELEKSKK